LTVSFKLLRGYNKTTIGNKIASSVEWSMRQKHFLEKTSLSTRKVYFSMTIDQAKIMMQLICVLTQKIPGGPSFCSLYTQKL
jgi:hypothetical protein